MSQVINAEIINNVQALGIMSELTIYRKHGNFYMIK